jgi:DNA repair exonuclease SbcCD ATPase subunit
MLMDNAKTSQITAIVRAMNKAGMPVEDIRTNLREMNLSEEEAEQILAQAKVEPTTAEVHAAVNEVKSALKTGEHLEPIKPMLEEQKTQVAELKESVDTVQQGIEEHSGALEELAAGAAEHRNKLDEIRAGLADLHERNAEIKEKVGDVAQVYADVKELKEMMLELKPAIAALTAINQKILETNREIVMRLKK